MNQDNSTTLRHSHAVFNSDGRENQLKCVSGPINLLRTVLGYDTLILLKDDQNVLFSR